MFSLSLHDALPICKSWLASMIQSFWASRGGAWSAELLSGSAMDTRAWMENAISKSMMWVIDDFAPGSDQDRKSTRLNSSHVAISYAVLCLKKKSTTKGKRNTVWTEDAISAASATDDTTSYTYARNGSCLYDLQ